MNHLHSLQSILARHAVSEAQFLGQGMEARVYALDAHRVLKIYHRPTPRTHLATLQSWYARLDTRYVPFRTPAIHEIAAENGLLYTIENRLSGHGFDTVLPILVKTQLHKALETYFDALDALGHIQITGPVTQYKLFDEDNISAVAQGDWYSFLHRYVKRRLAQLATHFQKDVAGFSGKAARLLASLSQPFHGPLSLIHGDYCPGNIVVDERGVVTGVLDFGLFTMVGDPMFDIATGCAFFDMYDEYTQHTRQQLYALAIQRYGEQAREKLYLYLLIYSVLSANIYAEDCSDGHYAWCMRNLNNSDYWAWMRE